MKIISVATLKGGTGKTSAVFNLSGFLAENNKVCVIDCDPQANFTSNCKIDENADGFKSIVDIFERQLSPEEIIVKSPINQLPNLDVIPSSVMLTATELRLAGYSARELILRNYFKKHKKFFSNYDYILMDTNPSLGVVNQNTHVIANHILLICDISINGFKGSDLFCNLWAGICDSLDIPNNISGFIINRFDKRNKLSENFLDFCKSKDFINSIMFDTIVPENVQLRKGEIYGMPINIFDTKCTGYIAYQNLYKEMQKRGIIDGK